MPEAEMVSPEVASLLEAWNLPAALLDRDYTILAANEAYRALYGPEGEVLGRRCHQVSHRYRLPCDQMGEACPLGEALRTGRASRALHVHWNRMGKAHEEVRIVPLRDARGEIRGFLEVLQPLHTVAARPSAMGLVGASPAFRRALELLTRAAPSETTVLLLGETGTGKELLAKTVHDLSPRRERSFVPLDCSGLTESLFESELFGHEKGAFTGATHRKKGLVEAAEGGTLFLDEVGDIPLALQVKLLRLLESGTYRRVGSPDVHRANFRLVCATHQDLEGRVRAGAFRPDLYYRISAFPVRVPPLRERTGDISLLADSMLQRIEPDRSLRLSEGALEVLRGYGFPGNVRELLNVLERAALLTDGEVIEPEDLADHLRGTGGTGAMPPRPRGIETLQREEQRYLRWALRRHEGDNRSLAEALGISERTLYRKLNELRDRPETDD